MHCGGVSVVEYIIFALIYLTVTACITGAARSEGADEVAQTFGRAALLTPVWPLGVLFGIVVGTRWLWRVAEIDELVSKISTTDKDGV